MLVAKNGSCIIYPKAKQFQTHYTTIYNFSRQRDFIQPPEGLNTILLKKFCSIHAEKSIPKPLRGRIKPEYCFVFTTTSATNPLGRGPDAARLLSYNNA